MKKILINLVFLVTLFTLGCSDKGILRITNWSDYMAWYVLGSYEEWLDGGYSVEYDWDLSTSIFGDEEKEVNVEIGGEYIFTEFYSKTITPGSTSKIDIYTNAGEIIVWNESDDYTILEVYLSPSDDISWGSNDLMGTIEIGQWVSWYVTPGWWDLLVVDNCGEFIIFDIYIGLGDTYIYYFDGLKSGEDTAQMKLENAKKYTEQTKDRVQQKEKN
jgi:hypothetical protein